MSYAVKEAYPTLQGEGARSGRAAVLLRFAGCNLWSGREADRLSAICRFCDTDFVGLDGPGGGRFETAGALARHVADVWRAAMGASDHPAATPYLVCTGGEPLLQLDPPLVAALKRAGFEIAVETNGTIAAPGGVDWLCVSPKGAAALALQGGDELKLVYPQAEPEAQPERFAELAFQHFFLQPLDEGDPARNAAHAAAAARYCQAHPQWRLSLQTHKILGLR
ncbi:MAG: 7-carboxy-7-deazaguanine synthase [Pseudomonadota bacterium]